MSLIEKIVELANGENYEHGQIVDMHAIEDGPLKVRVPTGWRETDMPVVTKEHMKDIFLVIDRRWEEELSRVGTISRTVDLETCRLRCNAFRERGGTKHGLVIRKVPYQPIPLDKLGLPGPMMRAVAQMRGLVLRPVPARPRRSPRFSPTSARSATRWRPRSSATTTSRWPPSCFRGTSGRR